MTGPIAAGLEPEDTIRLLVRDRERRRLYVIAAVVVSFAGFGVATILMYLNP